MRPAWQNNQRWQQPKSIETFNTNNNNSSTSGSKSSVNCERQQQTLKYSMFEEVIIFLSWTKNANRIKKPIRISRAQIFGTRLPFHIELFSVCVFVYAHYMLLVMILVFFSVVAFILTYLLSLLPKLSSDIYETSLSFIVPAMDWVLKSGCLRLMYLCVCVCARYVSTHVVQANMRRATKFSGCCLCLSVNLRFHVYINIVYLAEHFGLPSTDSGFDRGLQSCPDSLSRIRFDLPPNGRSWQTNSYKTGTHMEYSRINISYQLCIFQQKTKASRTHSSSPYVTYAIDWLECKEIGGWISCIRHIQFEMFLLILFDFFFPWFPAYFSIFLGSLHLICAICVAFILYFIAFSRISSCLLAFFSIFFCHRHASPVFFSEPTHVRRKRFDHIPRYWPHFQRNCFFVWSKMHQ